jgi:hypothetical protein
MLAKGELESVKDRSEGKSVGTWKAERNKRICVGLKVIFKVRKQSTSRALCEGFTETYRRHFPKAIPLFGAGIEDALSYLKYPGSHYAKTRSASPLERLFRELKRRARVVGVFPNESSAQVLGTEIMLRSSEERALRRYLTIGPELTAYMESRGFSPKAEFHLTLIGFKQGPRLKAAFDENPELADEVAALASSLEALTGTFTTPASSMS